MATTSTTTTERHEYSFQAEIKQLLHLLSHSLYQSREIAIRELVSNASDALDKMRFVALTEEQYREPGPLEIIIEANEERNELIIRDNGIGMNEEELVANLGTIARSGSGEFLKAVTNQVNSKPDLSLIGQFGVGFYSAFMLADRVTVRTRSYKEEAGREWESDGTGTFSVTPVADPIDRGTAVILHLKEDAKEFASPGRVKAIIERYSSFVPHPIRLGAGGDVINHQKPIWVEPRNQVSDEQHAQFYQHLTHHTGESPLWHLHMSVDSPIQFNAVVYCPPTNLEKLGFSRLEHGLSLCAKRILVQSDCRELLPEYLRFLRGLVDSEDLPLNVSRETLQDNSVIRRIRTSLVKGILDRLDKLAKDDPEAFATFYQQFGQMLKEGIMVDHLNRERLAKLLRFESTAAEGSKSRVSLEDYIARMGEKQTRIYYLGGPDASAIRNNPNLEIFRRRKLEVILLTEPIDEFVMNALAAFQGKDLTSIDSEDLGLPETGDESAAAKAESPTANSPGMAHVLDLFRSALGDKVAEVRVSKRLIDSPCCLVNAEGGLSSQMQRILKMANQELPATAKILEINPDAPLIGRLRNLGANPDHDPFIKRCALQLWSNATVLDGALPDPEEMVKRVQDFMTEAAEKRSPLIL
jgi:molecular chaperone HtpG